MLCKCEPGDRLTLQHCTCRVAAMLAMWRAVRAEVLLMRVMSAWP